MYQAVVDPIFGNLLLSSLVSCIPLVAFFLCLVTFKLHAHISAIIALGLALIVSIFVYQMPVHFTFLTALEGAAYGIFPVSIIMFSAIWFYELTVASGRSKDLQILFDSIGGGDVRIQGVLIAFCFGTLLEALAGFGAPIAITSTMLIALGVSPIKSAIAVLLADTAPVAFGAVAIPITTAANMAPGPYGAEATAHYLASIAGIIAPIFSALIPIMLICLLDGKKGFKECWIPALVIGLSFAIAQFLVSNYFAYEITDIIASLSSFVGAFIFLQFWKHTKYGQRHLHSIHKKNEKVKIVPSRIWMSIMPYIVIIVAFGIGQFILPLKATDIKFAWPGLADVASDGTVTPLVLNYEGKDPGISFNFNWLSNCGTIILICGFIIAVIYEIFNEHGRYTMKARTAFVLLKDTFVRLRLTILTVSVILSLAYVMNFSGQTASIGLLLAQTGVFFAFISPTLGWIGTAVTGSDMSANALFSSMQVQAAKSNAILCNVDAELFLASNTMGGVMGKMISPQSLAVAAAATGETESSIFKHTIKWSLGLLFGLCIIITVGVIIILL